MSPPRITSRPVATPRQPSSAEISHPPKAGRTKPPAPVVPLPKTGEPSQLAKGISTAVKVVLGTAVAAPTLAAGGLGLWAIGQGVLHLSLGTVGGGAGLMLLAGGFARFAGEILEAVVELVDRGLGVPQS